MDVDGIFLQLRRLIRENGVYVMNKLFDDYLTGPVTRQLTDSCFLCGLEETLTKEHVLPKWVFQSKDEHTFVTDVNKLSQRYISATLPACQKCNSELLNGVERYVQKTLSAVDLKSRFYSQEEWENIIRWLEIIDLKFQIWDIRTKFRVLKGAEFVPDLADFSIAFMRDLSVRSIKAKARLALKRIATKGKRNKVNGLVGGATKKPTFNYFHKSGHFIYLEIPVYNRGFFCFFEKLFRNGKIAVKEAKQIIKYAYSDG